MKKEFIKKTAMLWIALSSFIAPAFADEEITPLVPMDTTFINTIVIPIQLQIIGQTHPIHHTPSRPVTNLMGIYEHDLYLFPVAESEDQEVTVVLCDEDEVEVYYADVLLSVSPELVALPSDLEGRYTLYYYIGDACYRGYIEL